MRVLDPEDIKTGEYVVFLRRLQNGKYAPINPFQAIVKINNNKIKFADKEVDVSELPLKK